MTSIIRFMLLIAAAVFFMVPRMSAEIFRPRECGRKTQRHYHQPYRPCYEHHRVRSKTQVRRVFVEERPATDAEEYFGEPSPVRDYRSRETLERIFGPSSVRQDSTKHTVTTTTTETRR